MVSSHVSGQPRGWNALSLWLFRSSVLAVGRLQTRRSSCFALYCLQLAGYAEEGVEGFLRVLRATDECCVFAKGHEYGICR